MKFSITIPAYKRTYLKEAIDSCLAQTYEDFELIVVNDASPEDLDSIVNSYSDDRIRYYRNETNCGAIDVVDNWNKCLNYAEGDYIICMGDDDKLLPCCLEEYKCLIEKYPGLGVYHAWTEIIDDNSNFKSVTQHRCEYESVYSLIWHRWDNRLHQYIGDFLFNANLLRQLGGFYKLPMAWASDDITAVICAESKGIANTQKVTFQYRDNGQTITNTGNFRIKVDAIVAEQEWYHLFLQNKPTNDCDLKYWNTINRQFDEHFKNKKKSYILKELSYSHLGSFCYWLNKKNKLNLTSKELLFLFLKSIVKKN